MSGEQLLVHLLRDDRLEVRIRQIQDVASRRKLLGRLARLEAAHCLGWTTQPFVAQSDQSPVPSLFEWPDRETTQQEEEEEGQTRSNWWRDVDPKRAVVRLLLGARLQLEALLVVDHFMDMRAQLALRLLLDHTANLSLTDVFTSQLIDQVVQRIGRISSSSGDPVDLRRFSSRSATSLLQLAILRHNSCPDLLEEITTRLIERLEEASAHLSLIDQNDRVERMHRLEMSWNRLTADIRNILGLMSVLLCILQQTGRLHRALPSALRFVQQDTAAAADGIIESESFARLLVVLVRLCTRSAFSVVDPAEDNETARLYRLLLDDNDDDCTAMHRLRRWRRNASRELVLELEDAILYWRTVFPRRTDLPTARLDQTSILEWRSHMLNNGNREATEPRELTQPRKFDMEPLKVTADTYSILKFVLNSWKTPPSDTNSIAEERSIPMRLDLCVDDICTISSDHTSPVAPFIAAFSPSASQAYRRPSSCPSDRRKKKKKKKATSKTRPETERSLRDLRHKVRQLRVPEQDRGRESGSDDESQSSRWLDHFEVEQQEQHKRLDAQRNALLRVVQTSDSFSRILDMAAKKKRQQTEHDADEDALIQEMKHFGQKLEQLLHFVEDVDSRPSRAPADNTTGQRDDGEYQLEEAVQTTVPSITMMMTDAEVETDSVSIRLATQTGIQGEVGTPKKVIDMMMKDAQQTQHRYELLNTARDSPHSERLPLLQLKTSSSSAQLSQPKRDHSTPLLKIPPSINNSSSSALSIL